MGEIAANYNPDPTEIYYRAHWQLAFQNAKWENWLINAVMIHDHPELGYAVELVKTHGFTVTRNILLGVIGEDKNDY